VVLAFQTCGDFEGGFARVYCDACRAEYLVAFFCTRRGFCPSCAAKRAAIFGALLREEILEEVGHAQWVFTIPRLLRPYFLHHRELLGQLSRAAWQTAHELIEKAGDEDAGVRPGVIAVVQTATDLLEWSPMCTLWSPAEAGTGRAPGYPYPSSTPSQQSSCSDTR